MNATPHARDFPGGAVEVRAHTAARARRLSLSAARLGAAVACAGAAPTRIRVWPAGGALPYLVIDVDVDDPEVVHRLLTALRRRVALPLRATVTMAVDASPRTWDGRWLGVARMAA